MRLISHPILCNYYVTYRCNAKCGFCDIWERPSPYVTLKNVEENLIALKKLGVKVIDFTGGEPLLHQQMDKIVKMAKEMKFITTLTTNGLLYHKFAEKLKGKVDMLHFSLDTADAKKHNQMRGVSCFEHVMDAIQLAKSLDERPDILYTVFDENINDIQEVYEKICLPNDLVLILNPAFAYGEVEAGNTLKPSSLKNLSRWGRKKNVYINEAFLALRRRGGNQINSPVCKAASTTIVISPENKLLLPCYHLGLQSFEIQNNLHDLYYSSEVQEIVAKEGRLPECQGCTINCYMQPSFAAEVNTYFWKALPSTIKYNRMKGTWKKALGIN